MTKPHKQTFELQASPSSTKYLIPALTSLRPRLAAGCTARALRICLEQEPIDHEVTASRALVGVGTTITSTIAVTTMTIASRAAFSVLLLPITHGYIMSSTSHSGCCYHYRPLVLKHYTSVLRFGTS